MVDDDTLRRRSNCRAGTCASNIGSRAQAMPMRWTPTRLARTCVSALIRCASIGWLRRRITPMREAAALYRACLAAAWRCGRAAECACAARRDSSAGLLGGHARCRPLRRRGERRRRPHLAGWRPTRALPRLLAVLRLRRPLDLWRATPPTAGAPTAAPHHCRPLHAGWALPAGARRPAQVQDSSRLWQHSDGAKRPVPVHRAGRGAVVGAAAMSICPSRATIRWRSSSRRRSCWPPIPKSPTRPSRGRSRQADPRTETG